MKNQRKAVLQILNDFFEKPSQLDPIIDFYIKGFNRQEAGFINTVAIGSVRYGYQLDYIIRKLSNLRFSRIDLQIKNLLRLSLYQLIYMDHIPDAAIVDEAVELSKDIRVKNSSSYINGILRNFIRNKEEILDFSNIHYKDRLRCQYSYPDWLVDLFLKIYPDNVEDMLSLYNKEARFDIRVNSIKISRNQLQAQLEEFGYRTSLLEKTENGMDIENPYGIFDSSLFKEGKFYVQAESSQMVGEIADLSNVESVLDACSAPGGKSSHLYEKSNGHIDLISCDLSEDKLELLRDNMTRLGHTNIKIIKQDACKYNNEFKGKFDLIILDLPCSSLGLLRRYPEMKYTKGQEDIDNLSKIQKDILENNSKYLKKSARIIYSTCSFTKEENESVIYEFLKNNENFILEGDIRRYNPLVNGSDGFTIGVLKNED